MIIIRTTKMHLQKKTQYKRISSTSFIFVSCLRAFSYYPSISTEKCPKCLSFLRFQCFAFIIISARNFLYYCCFCCFCCSCIDVIFLPMYEFSAFGVYIFYGVLHRMRNGCNARLLHQLSGLYIRANSKLH